MKHLRLFETETAFDAAKANLPEPWVALSLDVNKVHYAEKTEPSVPNNEIWYETVDGNSANYKATLEYILSTEMGALYTGPNVLSEEQDGDHWVLKFGEDVTDLYITETGASAIFAVVPDLGLNVGANITKISLPNSVTNIGGNAFNYCTNLTSIEIPNSVTSIGRSAFYNCTSLTSIEIPDSVTSIGYSAFYECTSLTSINIPNSVTSIGDSAFSGCISLTSIEIPDSVTSIGEYAFEGCSSLTSVTIGNSVTSIGIYAFESCTSLTSVEIPDSVTSIGDYAFEGCSSLTSITYSGTIAQWKAITKGSTWHTSVPATSVTCSDGTTTLD